MEILRYWELEYGRKVAVVFKKPDKLLLRKMEATEVGDDWTDKGVIYWVHSKHLEEINSICDNPLDIPKNFLKRIKLEEEVIPCVDEGEHTEFFQGGYL